MADISRCYQFPLVFTPPNGKPLNWTLDVSGVERLVEEIRRVSGPPRQGRLWDSRDALLRKMLQARNVLRASWEPIMQATLLAQMDYAGDTRRVREWLTRLKLTWAEFLALE